FRCLPTQPFLLPSSLPVQALPDRTRILRKPESTNSNPRHTPAPPDLSMSSIACAATRSAPHSARTVSLVRSLAVSAAAFPPFPPLLDSSRHTTRGRSAACSP